MKMQIEVEVEKIDFPKGYRASFGVVCAWGKTAAEAKKELARYLKRLADHPVPAIAKIPGTDDFVMAYANENEYGVVFHTVRGGVIGGSAIQKMTKASLLEEAKAFADLLKE